MPLRRIRGCRIAIVTYAGNDAEIQKITGVGFRPKALIIWLQDPTAQLNYGIKTDQDGDKTLYLDFFTGRVAWKPDHIISLDADGFTVGDGTGTTNIFNVGVAVYTCIALG